MSVRSVLFAAGVLAVSALLPLPAVTEESPQDPEEEVDEGLRRFGYLAGLARGCVVNGQQTDLEREAVDLHAGIARLLGTDRGFLFAAAFGYGTSVAVETADCQDVLSRYEARVAAFRAKQGAR
jgi:hypothetical protein